MNLSTGASSRFARGKNQQEKIAYICENCGAEVATNNEIPKCVGCGKELCEICNTYFLCPQDYHILEPRDQKKIKRLGRGIENARNAKVMFNVMPTILGAIGAVLLLLMIILRRDILYFLFGFLGGFLLLSGVLMYVMFHNFEDRENRRIKQKIRALVIPYNIPRVKRPINRDTLKQREPKPHTEAKKVAPGEVKTVFVPRADRKFTVPT
ncbi:MAG: hypothetical protein ACTSWW_07730 [Promethearchaeota archaeon]